MTPPSMIGRTAELAALEEVVDSGRRGGRAVAFVGGEAGIGKTRLVTELAARARAGGVRVLVGGCLDLGVGGIPYGPVVEVLRPLLEEGDRPPDALGGQIDGQTTTLQAIKRVLERLAADTPLALVIEDVHWADRSTRDLIAYLAATGPPPALGVVLTYRTEDLRAGHPLRGFIAELERRPAVRHLRLDRLGRADAAALLAATLGRAPHPALTETIYQRSEGNPFFLQELARAAATGAIGELPPLLGDTLTARLEHLSAPTQLALRVAAVGGRRVDHDRLAAVAPLDETELADALREARDANVVIADPVSRQYEFRHALLHEAVYASVLPGERSRYHAAYASLLEAGTSEPGIVEWAELAHHWRSAGRAEPALVATLNAALAAEAGYALPEAHRYYELALGLAGEQVLGRGHDPHQTAHQPGGEQPANPAPWPAVAPLSRAETIHRAGDAASRAGAFARAVELTGLGIAETDAATDPTSAGLLRERRAWFLWRAGDEVTALAEYEEAVALVPAEPPSAARARVLAAYADALVRGGRPVEARPIAEEAAALAAATDAAFDEGHARHMLGLALCALGERDEGIDELHRARLLAERNGDVADVAGTYVHLWRVLTEARRADEIVRLAVDAAEFCHATGMAVAAAMLDCLAAGFLEQLGRWDEAEARLPADEGTLWGLPAVVTPVVRGLLEVDRGRLRGAHEHLETARCLGVQVYDGRINGLLYRGLAELALWEDRPEDALAAVETGRQATTDDEMLGRLCMLGMRAAADVAERARATTGTGPSVDGAGDLMEVLTLLDARAHARQAPPASDVRASHATAKAELTRRDGRSDPELWAEAGTRWGELGFPAPAAYARWRLAGAVLNQGRRADSLPHWRAAHRSAVGLGAEPLRLAIEHDAARAALALHEHDQGDDGTGSAPAPFGLTARELEVLALVATGRTNRQIGQALFISEKTASVHVSRILAKVGASTRAQAAALAGQLGLGRAGTDPGGAQQ